MAVGTPHTGCVRAWQSRRPHKFHTLGRFPSDGALDCCHNPRHSAYCPVPSMELVPSRSRPSQYTEPNAQMPQRPGVNMMVALQTNPDVYATYIPHSHLVTLLSLHHLPRESEWPGQFGRLGTGCRTGLRPTVLHGQGRNDGSGRKQWDGMQKQQPLVRPVGTGTLRLGTTAPVVLAHRNVQAAAVAARRQNDTYIYIYMMQEPRGRTTTQCSNNFVKWWRQAAVRRGLTRGFLLSAPSATHSVIIFNFAAADSV